jgi:hypothetical protein
LNLVLERDVHKINRLETRKPPPWEEFKREHISSRELDVA